MAKISEAGKAFFQTLNEQDKIKVIAREAFRTFPTLPSMSSPYSVPIPTDLLNLVYFASSAVWWNMAKENTASFKQTHVEKIDELVSNLTRGIGSTSGGISSALQGESRAINRIPQVPQYATPSTSEYEQEQRAIAERRRVFEEHQRKGHLVTQQLAQLSSDLGLARSAVSEPPRDCRRRFRLSYAAMGIWSRAA